MEQPTFARSPEEFSELLKAPFPPTKLCLGEFPLTLAHAQILGEAIRGSDMLEHLYLVKCRITSLALKDIIDALKRNKSVTYLDLWNNSIDDEGADMIAEYIESSKILKTLNVSNNNITRLGVARIAEAVGASNSVAHLFIEHNFDIEDRIPEVFLNPLKTNRALCELRLSFDKKDEGWRYDEDFMTINIFLKENRTKPEEICDYLLQHHNMHFKFYRQKITLLGASGSGKSLLWRNLTSSKPIDDQQRETKKTSGMTFHVATSLTTKPFFQDSTFWRTGRQDANQPDMLLDAVMKLGNRLLHVEYLTRRHAARKKPRRKKESKVMHKTPKWDNLKPKMILTTQQFSSLSEIRSQPSRRQGGSSRRQKIDLQKVPGKLSRTHGSSINNSEHFGMLTDSVRLATSSEGEMYEFQKLAIKFAKRHVRKVDDDLFIPKSKAPKIEKPQVNVSVQDHIAMFENISKKGIMTVPSKKNTKKKQVKKVEKVQLKRKSTLDLPDSKSEIEYISRDPHRKARVPLTSQNDYLHEWFLQRRGRVKKINYSCLELSGDPLVQSIGKVVLPSGDYGISIICFNLGELDLNLFLTGKKSKSWRKLFFWLNQLYSRNALARENKADIIGGRVILVGTHLDVLLSKDTDAQGVLLQMNTELRKLKKSFEKIFIDVDSDLIVKNRAESTEMFFQVNNLTGEGIKSLYKAIEETSINQTMVTKRVLLKEYHLFDYLRPQALLLDEENKNPIIFREDKIKPLCAERKISLNKMSELLSLFSEGSGLSLWSPKNKVFFRDMGIVVKLFQVFFLYKIDFLGRSIEMTVDALAQFEIMEEHLVDNEQFLERPRTHFARLAWDSAGRYFVDLLREALLVCTVNKDAVPKEYLTKIQEYNNLLDGEMEDSDSDSDSATSDSSKEYLPNEFLFIPKFMTRGPTFNLKAAKCYFDFDSKGACTDTPALFQNILCLLLPLLDQFKLGEEFALYSNYAKISTADFEFFLIVDRDFMILSVEKDHYHNAFFILMLVEHVVAQTQMCLRSTFQRKIYFDRKGNVRKSDAKTRKLAPWFNEDNEDLEGEFEDLDQYATPDLIEEFYTKFVSNKE